MALFTTFYKDTDFNGKTGTAFLPATTPATTYRQVSKSWLKSAKLHDAISSLRFTATGSDGTGRIYLFEHDRYKGRFLGRTFGKSGEVQNLKKWGFNDRASSALLIRQHSVEFPPITLGDFGTPPLRERVADFVKKVPRIKRLRGDPIITWDMWPDFEPGSKFVHIKVPVRIDVPGWWDYDAEIRLWIYLYVDGGGRLRGSVRRYGAWVEGGVKTGKILNKLMAGILSRIGAIQTLLRDSLQGLDQLQLEGVYLLPGPAHAGSGNVHDDVSLVLVKQL